MHKTEKKRLATQSLKGPKEKKSQKAMYFGTSQDAPENSYKGIFSSLDLEIIGLYRPNIVALYSINQIAGKLGKKYAYINKKVNELIKRNILHYIVIGRSYLCSLNLSNKKTLLLLSEAESEIIRDISKKDSWLSETKQKVLAFISSSFFDLTIQSVIALDKGLIFVIDDLKKRHKIIAKFRNAVVVDRQELVDLLLEDRLLFQGSKVLYGYERFFETISHASAQLKIAYSPLSY